MKVFFKVIIAVILLFCFLNFSNKVLAGECTIESFGCTGGPYGDGSGCTATGNPATCVCTTTPTDTGTYCDASNPCDPGLGGGMSGPVACISSPSSGGGGGGGGGATCGCGGGESVQCCNTTGSDGCNYYGICSGTTCTTGGQVPGSCPAPTATPTPADSCAAFGGQAGCNTWCQGQGYSGCNTGCVGCFGPAATVAPTSAPSSGSTCTLNCMPSSSASCTGFVPGAGTCPAGDSCGVCPTTGGGGPAPTAIGGGGSCPACGTSGPCCAPNWCGMTTVLSCNPPIVLPTPPPITCTGCQSSNGFTCVDNNALCPAGQVCSAGSCINPTYSISGTVFKDTNRDGVQQTQTIYCRDNNVSGVCDNSNEYTSLFACQFGFPANNCMVKSQPETGYQGAKICEGAKCSTTASDGSYSLSGLFAGTYSVSLSPIPSGYSLTNVAGNTSPRNVTVGPNQNNVNFALQNPPLCTGGMSATSSTVNPGGTSTLSVTSCTNVNASPPTPFTWNPDTSSNNPPPTVSGQTDSPTSSTVTWTAPVCPLTQKTYTPQVAVGGPGGTTNYTTNIVVPQTYTLKADIRNVTDNSPCTATSGTPYTLSPVTLQAQGPTMDTETTSTGSATFACLVAGSYKVFMATPAGYSILGTSGGTFTGPNEIDTTVGPSNPNPEVAYCIAPINPWFQTDSGDARFSSLKDPVPTGEVASTDPNYPGLFISSNSPSDFGQGTQSGKNLTLDDEYSFNQNSQNRNGTVGFDYYLNQASTKGVSIIPITNVTDITGTGVYEYPTDDTNPIITQFPSSIFGSGNRITILFPNDVTIDTNITVPKGALLIIAAKGDITVDSSVTELDGYYSAQGSINLNSRDSRTPKCQDATLLDQQLVVNGALIANALKPFSTTGTGVVQNDRTLCLNNLTTPSLVVKSRLDFLTLMTDFYKVSLSRLSE